MTLATWCTMDNVDWRLPMIGVLAGLAALGDANASTDSIPGGMWLSVYVACGAAAAILAASAAIKKIFAEIPKG